ncbi:hypothetical protein MMC12_008030 [Toensbergia leucococca]|nr:hypothetical protein [Toensbergia leucococca]
MPKRRAQPPTPPDLPAIPSDCKKKAYYPAGNKVYYCLKSSGEWRTGTVSDETQSTQQHIVRSDATGEDEFVDAEYIRERTF